MTDRELLELAAKAAGYELDWYPSTRCDLVSKRSVGEVIKLDWNPLTDDGDALRLAVKLEIDVLTPDGDNKSGVFYSGGEELWENATIDPYAATRRAIVRAAAEIGKTK